MEELWDDYLEYLIWKCGLDRYTGLEKIFQILHDMEFTYILDRDDNRYDDGAELRDDYEIPEEYFDYVDEFMNQPCSVMEMLVALAIRVEGQYIGDPADEHPERFFVEMIDNLGLNTMRRGRMREYEVIKIIRRWLDRKFEKDGRGSPFPVRYDHRDQRCLEIWDQMNNYISENYV